ncbi:MAG TPA: GNAT family N-acetyltransferase [Egibacteraceae bacterium]|nr:GNAT family N-acetyltransferase [Egibacteraceae bacterium]
MANVRRFEPRDREAVWALADIPFKGYTADPIAPIPLPVPDGPGHWRDLVSPERTFLAMGGEFLVAELDANIVGMGGIRSNERREAEIMRVRVHPAVRRQGVGRALMDALEQRAADLGFRVMHLGTTVEQPEAIAFYRSLGYKEIGREAFPTWVLVYFTKPVGSR